MTAAPARRNALASGSGKPFREATLRAGACPLGVQEPRMNGWRSRIPRTSTLLAFEAVARLGSMREAAAERRTSLSAISRHVRNLQQSLGVKLFERSGKGIVPTEEGREYFRAVQTSIYGLHAAASGLETDTVTVTVGCTQEISQHLLLPVFPSLKRSLGSNVRLRILSCDYDMHDLLLPTGIDIYFDYSVSRVDKGSARLLDEKVVPVASPALAQRFERILAEHPRHWGAIPRLELAPRIQLWATWTTWFRAYGCDPPEAPVERFENYEYLLDAAANGDGMAIGWDGFVNRHLCSNRLRVIGDDWKSTNVGLYAVTTPAGSRNRCARELLGELANAIPRLLGKDAPDWRDRADGSEREDADGHARLPTGPEPVGTSCNRTGGL